MRLARLDHFLSASGRFPTSEVATGKFEISLDPTPRIWRAAMQRLLPLNPYRRALAPCLMSDVRNTRTILGQRLIRPTPPAGRPGHED